MKVEVFGSGCCNCTNLYDLVQQAAAQTGQEVELVKVTDMMEIAKKGIMRTPALAIDGKIVSAGRVPKLEEIAGWLAGNK
jgi:small redox-active disulfide protein 2